MKRVDAIITADLHIRDTAPACRLDNWMETQARKYKWLCQLAGKYECPILVAGDLFNHWKPSPFLLGWALRNLPDGIIAIPGQHDLPAHNLQDIEKSGIQVLSDSGKILLMLADTDYDDRNIAYYGFPWGTPLTGAETNVGELRNVALLHYGVYESKPHYPGAENTGGTAKSVINKMKGFDLIVTGDNHLTFTCEHNGQLLVNAGSFMRTTAAQADHKPCVFLWHSEDNTVTQVFVPIEDGVISREHIDRTEERDERLESFISRLDNDVELSISFRTNLKTYLAQNKISKEITDIIWETLK